MLGYHQHPQPPAVQHEPGDPAGPGPGRHGLLDQHQRGDHGDPEEVRYADHEQQRHQRPAAAQAVEAMSHAHRQSAAAPLAPMAAEAPWSTNSTTWPWPSWMALGYFAATTARTPLRSTSPKRPSWMS